MPRGSSTSCTSATRYRWSGSSSGGFKTRPEPAGSAGSGVLQVVATAQRGGALSAQRLGHVGGGEVVHLVRAAVLERCDRRQALAGAERAVGVLVGPRPVVHGLRVQERVLEQPRGPLLEGAPQTTLPVAAVRIEHHDPAVDQVECVLLAEETAAEAEQVVSATAVRLLPYAGIVPRPQLRTLARTAEPVDPQAAVERGEAVAHAQ